MCHKGMAILVSQDKKNVQPDQDLNPTVPRLYGLSYLVAYTSSPCYIEIRPRISQSYREM
jgi:hypothetical protein